MAHRVSATSGHATPQGWWVSLNLNRSHCHIAHSITDDGVSCLEEPPETPAPIFAVRAFKTAIFGTPHPHDIKAKCLVPQEEEGLEPNIRMATSKSSHAPRVGEETQSEPSIAYTNLGPNSHLRLDPLASPAKGILLTPGTAAARRKTVSFGTIEAEGGRKATQHSACAAEAEPVSHLGPMTLAQEKVPDKMHQSTLTKTLIELSKRKLPKEQVSAVKDIQRKDGRQASSIDSRTDSILEPNTDMTVDLSQPRSRSGQHWKTEYDQYHKRSNREMKKIIKYGQNVKSYAVKKDSEATSLSEKLKKELAKVAAMEIKVNKLATQLSNAQFQAEGDTNQSRLVNELAQQTALVIRYKQKADEHKAALQQQDFAEQFEEHQNASKSDIKADAPTEIASIRVELESLRTTAKAAGDQAMKLEKENAALKRSLARVKEEMMSYETRRQAREERLKKREAKHRAAREQSEMRFAKLKEKHEELLRASGVLPVVDMMAEIQSIQKEAGIQDVNEYESISGTNHHQERDKESARVTRGDEQPSRPYISPRKKRLQKPDVDIWTISSPRDDEDQAPSSKEPTELPPSSVRHDIDRTLREIDQNLVPKQETHVDLDFNIKSSRPKMSSEMPTSAFPPPTNAIPSGIGRVHNRHGTISSSRPSMISRTSSPAKLLQPSQPTNNENAYFKPSFATTGRSASLMSRVGSRTNTMGSGRVSSLSSERAEAAKARLARRSAEKRRKQDIER